MSTLPHARAASTLATSLLIAAERSEFSGYTNGSFFTPTFSAERLVGIIQSKGAGHISAVSYPGGTALSFQAGGQQNANTASIVFLGPGLGKTFMAEEGEVSFTLTSSYSFAERLALPTNNSRFLFEARDDNGVRFCWYQYASGGRLTFQYQTGGASPTYYLPPAGTEEALFGRGTSLSVRLIWTATSNTLFLNGKAVKTTAYAAVTPNWGTSSSLTFGAKQTQFYAFDDLVDHFSVLSQPVPPDTTPPTAPSIVTATPLTSTFLSLSWNTSVDEQYGSGLKLYRVYRNGNLLTEVTSPTYVDTGLKALSTYYYSVSAVDNAGNESSKTPAAQARTLTASNYPPVIQWTVQGEQPVTVLSGQSFGKTGVTAELRAIPTQHGTRYDVRLRNRTPNTYTHESVKILISRSGASPSALIDGMSLPVPAQITQQWSTPLSSDQRCKGTVFGFSYTLLSNNNVMRTVGPPARLSCYPGVPLEGRSDGVVRIDGKSYLIGDFWARQPRSITITPTEIILTLFSGQEPLRSGEDAIDRFAILNTTSIPDDKAKDELDALPTLTTGQRAQLIVRYGLASAFLSSSADDPIARKTLEQYERWQETSWTKTAATTMLNREFYGESEPDKTTLSSLFMRGNYTPTNTPGICGWRDYGDIQWTDGMSSLHYDWIRAAVKHHLKTGDREALRWALAATRHAISVDYVWYGSSIGAAQFEKGDHGLGAPLPPSPSHTWNEGLLMMADLTNDPWVREAAMTRAQYAVTWIAKAGPTPYRVDGALRILSWPMLICVATYNATGDPQYLNAAKSVMDGFIKHEALSGSKGYMKRLDGANTVIVLHEGYIVRALVKFAEVAIRAGQWTPIYEEFMERFGTWVSTPMPNGPYVPANPSAGINYGAFEQFWCPLNETCVSKPTHPDKAYLLQYADLFAYLAVRNPSKWSRFFVSVFTDMVQYSATSVPTNIGYLTNNYAGTESKILGWHQLFNDLSAQVYSAMFQVRPVVLSADVRP